MNRLFVDTSAWFAYINRLDPHHRAVRKVFAGLNGRLLTSNCVLDEIVTLCRVRLGHGAAVRVGSVLLDSGAVDLIRITSADEAAAWDLFQRRGDKGYSFTDCTTFVLLRRLKLVEAVALDRHFQQEGFWALPEIPAG